MIHPIPEGEALKQEIARYQQELMDCYIRSGQHSSCAPDSTDDARESEPAVSGADNRDTPNPPITEPLPPTVPPAPLEDNEIRNSPEMIAAYNAFAAANSGTGRIKVQTFTAQRTLPVSRARVEVCKLFGDKRYTIAVSRTDASGQIPDVEVPAVPRDLSQAPGSPQPYVSYYISVLHPDFVPVEITDVPVFDGVVSVQRVDLIPPSAMPQGVPEEYLPTLPITDL